MGWTEGVLEWADGVEGASRLMEWAEGGSEWADVG
jgi:hypothetical protein